MELAVNTLYFSVRCLGPPWVDDAFLKLVLDRPEPRERASNGAGRTLAHPERDSQNPSVELRPLLRLRAVASAEPREDVVDVRRVEAVREEDERRPDRHLADRREDVEVEVVHAVKRPPVEAEPVV